MHLNNEGKIVAYDKVRLSKNAIKKMIEEVLLNIENGKEYEGKFFIYHSDTIDLAMETKKQLEEVFPNIKNKIVLLNIGCIIASHTGRGTVAVSYLGCKRV
jgi:fatty acid-binding protein DegV